VAGRQVLSQGARGRLNNRFGPRAWGRRGCRAASVIPVRAEAYHHGSRTGSRRQSSVASHLHARIDGQTVRNLGRRPACRPGDRLQARSSGMQRTEFGTLLSGSQSVPAIQNRRMRAWRTRVCVCCGGGGPVGPGPCIHTVTSVAGMRNTAVNDRFLGGSPPVWQESFPGDPMQAPARDQCFDLANNGLRWLGAVCRQGRQGWRHGNGDCAQGWCAAVCGRLGLRGRPDGPGGRPDRNPQDPAWAAPRPLADRG
jgi:hypothetical protein